MGFRSQDCAQFPTRASIAESIRMLLCAFPLACAMLAMSCSSAETPPPAPHPSIATAEEFPLTVGTYWVYQGNVKYEEAGKVKETKVAWRMEVMRVNQVGRYEVVLLQGHPNDLAWFGPGKPRGGHVIVRDRNKYYEIPPEDLDKVLSDETHIASLLKPEHQFLEFPLPAGKCFGVDPGLPPRQDAMYCWSVAGPKSVDLSNIEGVGIRGMHDEFELVYRTNPDHTIVHFVPGIGMTSYAYVHHGTVSEADVHMTEFHPH